MGQIDTVYMVWCREKQGNRDWQRVGEFVYSSVEWAKADMETRKVDWFEDSSMYGNSRKFDYCITEHPIVGLCELE